MDSGEPPKKSKKKNKKKMASADVEDSIEENAQVADLVETFQEPDHSEMASEEPPKKDEKKVASGEDEDCIEENMQQADLEETSQEPEMASGEPPEKKNKIASGDVDDFIEQNRQLADLVDTFRSISESEKHWESRREFIFRNINDYEDPHVDHLLALSMVWANNVFLGCRYSPDLLEKVREMAEGIVVEDAPVFKTRDEIIKQQRK